MNKNVLLLSAGFFLISLGFTGPHRFTTILFQEAGKPQLGFLSLFLIYVFFALTTSVSGRLISRFGPKISMILASVSYAVYVAVLPVFHPIVMMVMSIAVGISAAFLWSSQSLYLVSVSQKQTRGLSAGIFSAGNSLASFLSVIFLGFILERLALGRSIIFAAVSLFGFLGVAVLGLLSPDKLKKPGVKKNTVDWRMVFRSPTLLKLSLLWWSMTYGVGFSIASMPLMLVKRWGVAMTGAVGSLYWLFPLIFSLFSGIVSDKAGREPVLKMGIFLAVLGAVGLLLPGGWWLVISNILISISHAVLQTGTYAAMKEIAGKTYLELVNSYFWLASAAGVALAVGIGMTGMWQLSIGVMLAMLAATVIFSLPLIHSLTATRKNIIAELGAE